MENIELPCQDCLSFAMCKPLYIKEYDIWRSKGYQKDVCRNGARYILIDKCSLMNELIYEQIEVLKMDDDKLSEDCYDIFIDNDDLLKGTIW